MPSLYVTGPAHIYCATSTGMPGSDPYTPGSPAYLGTAEAAPQIEITPFYEPVMNDIGGGCPTDYLYAGEEGLIIADLTRWNEGIFAALQARPNVQDNTRGSLGAGDVGSLMATEGLTFCSWVQFPYQSKSVYSTNNMPTGYRFLSTFLFGPDIITPGTRANKRRIIIKAIRAYKASDGTWKLYDNDCSALPATPPTGSSGAVSS